MSLIRLLIATVLLINASTLVASPVEGQFKLPLSGPFVATPGCELYTHLVLKQESGALLAVMTDEVGPRCTIRVPQNPRIYPVKSAGTDECGSLTLIAQDEMTDGLPSLTITDHRARSCDDKTADVAVQVLTPEGMESLEGYVIRAQRLVNPVLAPARGVPSCLNDPACDL